MQKRAGTRIAVLFGFCFVALWMPATGLAGFPERTVQVVVGIAPGGATDAIARVLAQKLSEKWGQAVVVENRPGGEGTIASNVVAHAAPDGYTLLLVTTNFTLTPSQFRLAFDPLKSFEPVIMLGETPEFLIVNPDTVPVRSLQELLVLAKSKPGLLNFGSGGTSSPTFMITKLLQQAAGIELTNVSYRGMGPALVALLGGEIQMMFGAASDSTEFVKSGKLRVLAVSTAVRSPQMPDVPTVAEAASLPGFNATAWYGVLVPAETPPTLVTKLHDDIASVLNDPQIRSRLAAEGFLVTGSSADEFDRFLRADVERWSKLAKTVSAQ